MSYKPWEHWDDTNELFTGACNAQYKGFICTELPDHYGNHVAKGTGGNVGCFWPNLAPDEPLVDVHTALLDLERDLR